MSLSRVSFKHRSTASFETEILMDLPKSFQPVFCSLAPGGSPRSEGKLEANSLSRTTASESQTEPRRGDDLDDGPPVPGGPILRVDEHLIVL